MIDAYHTLPFVLHVYATACSTYASPKHQPMLKVLHVNMRDLRLSVLLANTSLHSWPLSDSINPFQ